MNNQNQTHYSPRQALVDDIDLKKKHQNKRIAHMQQWAEAMCDSMGGESEVEMKIIDGGESASFRPVGFTWAYNKFPSVGTTWNEGEDDNEGVFILDDDGDVRFTNWANTALHLLHCDDEGIDYVARDVRKLGAFPPTEENVHRFLSDMRLWKKKWYKTNLILCWITPLVLLVLLAIATFVALTLLPSSKPSSVTLPEIVMEGLSIHKTTEAHFMKITGRTAIRGISDQTHSTLD